MSKGKGEKKLTPYRIILEKCLGIRSGETVLIVTDRKKRPIANALLEEARKMAKEVGLVEIEERSVDGEEPPEFIASVMRKCNVAILVTSKSLTHTNARRQASEIGVRVASLPGITDKLISRAIPVDYDFIDRLNKKLTSLLIKTSTITVQSPKGTNIKFRIDPARPVISDNGLLRTEGAFGNLPAGEVFLSPPEGTSEGVIVIDGSILDEIVDKPIKIEVKGGYATAITGGKTAKRLLDTITPLGKESFNIAEFGIGTNPKAKITGNVLEDEKVIGTCHIALGNSLSVGGRAYAKSHIDCVIRNPTVLFDKKKVIHRGKFLLGKI